MSLYTELYERSLTDLWPHLPQDLTSGQIADLGGQEGILSDILATTFSGARVHCFGPRLIGPMRGRFSASIDWIDADRCAWADIMQRKAPSGFDLMISHAGADFRLGLEDIVRLYWPYLKPGGRLLIHCPTTLNVWLQTLFDDKQGASVDMLELRGGLGHIIDTGRDSLTLWSSQYVLAIPDADSLAATLDTYARGSGMDRDLPKAGFAALMPCGHLREAGEGGLIAGFEHQFAVCRKGV